MVRSRHIAASFDALMGPAGHGIPDPEVLVSGGWESVRTVVDVGGGTGSLLAEILRRRPTVRGTLVDLPLTVARSAEIFQAAGVSERVTPVGQSFFDPLPPGGDLYLLKSVPVRTLHRRVPSHRGGVACSNDDPALVALLAAFLGAGGSSQVPLEVFDDSDETVGRLCNFSRVQRQLVSTNRSALDRARAAPDLAQFPVNAFEVGAHLFASADPIMSDLLKPRARPLRGVFPGRMVQTRTADSSTKHANDVIGSYLNRNAVLTTVFSVHCHGSPPLTERRLRLLCRVPHVRFAAPRLSIRFCHPPSLSNTAARHADGTGS